MANGFGGTNKIQNTREGGSVSRTEMKPYFDMNLLLVVIFLLALGLVMVFSSSSYSAGLKMGDPEYYLKKQLFAIAVGFVGMAVAALVPYQSYMKLGVILWFPGVIFLLLVRSSFGRTINNANRWLYFGSLSVQPAEIAKLCLIVCVASLICYLGKEIESLKGYALILVAAVPIAGIMWKVTRDLSSAVIAMSIALIMYWVAVKKAKYWIITLCIGVTGAIGIVFNILKKMEKYPVTGEFFNYRELRVIAWMNPEAYPLQDGYQTLQALYAIGSGGAFGKGLGQSTQKLIVPEAQNDMIFSIICEELGVFGAIVVILSFIILIWRLMIIANNVNDLFGGLLVTGIIAHLSVQVILNIAVCTNIIPNTGISLPFISYGGTSLLFLLIEIGIAISVGRSIQVPKGRK